MNKPAQQTVVPSASVKELLACLAIKKMKQLGGKLGYSLQSDLGVKTVGDLLQFFLVIVISGETGCGKTTQLPQYILESEIESGRGAFCNIICTQLRRISAMAVSDRVSAERGEPLGESVGYKVRLEGMSGKNTLLLFCTTVPVVFCCGVC